MPAQEDVASKLALLQAEVEQLRFELGEQKKARAVWDAKAALLSEGLLGARSEITALEKKLAELRLSSERSFTLLKAIEPEKLASELSRLYAAVASLRDSLRRHEGEVKKP